MGQGSLILGRNLGIDALSKTAIKYWKYSALPYGRGIVPVRAVALRV